FLVRRCPVGLFAPGPPFLRSLQAYHSSDSSWSFGERINSPDSCSRALCTSLMSLGRLAGRYSRQRWIRELKAAGTPGTTSLTGLSIRSQVLEFIGKPVFGAGPTLLGGRRRVTMRYMVAPRLKISVCSLATRLLTCSGAMYS